MSDIEDMGKDFRAVRDRYETLKRKAKDMLPDALERARTAVAEYNELVDIAGSGAAARLSMTGSPESTPEESTDVDASASPSGDADDDGEESTDVDTSSDSNPQPEPEPADDSSDSKEGEEKEKPEPDRESGERSHPAKRRRRKTAHPDPVKPLDPDNISFAEPSPDVVVPDYAPKDDSADTESEKGSEEKADSDEDDDIDNLDFLS